MKDLFNHRLQNLMTALLVTVIIATGLSACSSDGAVEEAALEPTTTPVTEAPAEEIIEEEAPPAEVVYNLTAFDRVSEADKDSYYKRPAIKGVYVSGHVAGIGSWMDTLIDLADTTEINAFVIDVKDDNGRITFDMDLDAVDAIGAEGGHIRDMDGLMDTLYEHDIYPIARIVTFKDPYLAKNRQELAIKNQDGSLWYYKNVPWLNPYNRDSWVYVVDVAKEAAKVGFKEIQFDYIRFEATSSLKNASFDDLEGDTTREEIILEFVDYATEELRPYGVEVSADVFGTVINSAYDAKIIGQDYKEMAHRLDVICPMVYPSHYGFGFYGTPAGQHSDLYPYRIIKGSMDDSTEKLKEIPQGENVAVVRPWLQAFTASYLGSGNYMVYGKEAIREQIQATYDAGLEEWILWHAGVRYNKAALLPEEE